MTLPPVYSPKEVEARWYPEWESRGFFRPDTNAREGPFTIVIPPPNVTGILHMGHALNNTLQDILIRWKRMQGYAALWVPGTDHAGIATQNVVERQLAKEKVTPPLGLGPSGPSSQTMPPPADKPSGGVTRHQLGREAFVKKVWAWKEQYGSTIVQQLRRLGSSCDWSRERFTMDEGLSRAVETAFLELYRAGLIYRGYYLVNWCPRCQTALSDEEVQHEEIKGHLWHIQYQVKGEGSRVYTPSTLHPPPDFIVVATTRPETLLGDVAVAVHPEDERYRSLAGRELILPILKRPLKVIQDPSVDREFGTGAVKVTPAHDPTDFLLGQKHGLEAIRVMDAQGRMNEQAGPYAGLDRFECRKKIVEELKAQGLLVKIEEHVAAVGHCYRCRTIIEPTLSPQWFVRMKPLAQLGIEAVEKDRMRFIPERWTSVYLDWLRNIRDWCISRQIWWGHRIPAWYCRRCYPAYQENQQKSTLSGTLVMNEQEAGIHVGLSRPEACRRCAGKELVQDEDVLDTWFSSWLWPFSTLGWPEGRGEASSGRSHWPEGRGEASSGRSRWPEQTKDLATFYPTSVLVTGPDIIFFWVARMVMAGKFFLKRIPFKDVYIHGIIRVEGGRKMSKSLGNIIDPLEVIDRIGADALRFSIAHMTSEGQDLYLSENKFLLGRNFANKLWNAARLILEGSGQGQGQVRPFNPRALTVPDQWILVRLQETVREVTGSLERYGFSEAARRLYQFVWHDLCDWYLEIAKLQREDQGAVAVQATNWVLWDVLERTLRLLHPFMPFITEELWHRMGAAESLEATIMKGPWPEPESWVDPDKLVVFERLQEVVTEVRNMRATFRVPLKDKVKLTIRMAGISQEKDLSAPFQKIIQRLAGVDRLEVLVDEKTVRPSGAIVSHLPGKPGMSSWDLIVPLEGLVDLEVERKRIEKELGQLQDRAKAKRGRLEDSIFRSKAPAEVIQEEEASLKELEAELSRWNESLNQIQ